MLRRRAKWRHVTSKWRHFWVTWKNKVSSERIPIELRIYRSANSRRFLGDRLRLQRSNWTGNYGRMDFSGGLQARRSHWDSLRFRVVQRNGRFVDDVRSCHGILAERNLGSGLGGWNGSSSWRWRRVQLVKTIGRHVNLEGIRVLRRTGDGLNRRRRLEGKGAAALTWAEENLRLDLRLGGGGCLIARYGERLWRGRYVVLVGILIVVGRWPVVGILRKAARRWRQAAIAILIIVTFVVGIFVVVVIVGCDGFWKAKFQDDIIMTSKWDLIWFKAYHRRWRFRYLHRFERWFPELRW